MHQTSKTIETMANAAALEGKINDSHRGFLDDLVNFCSNLFALTIVKHNIPFSVRDSDEW